VRRVAGDLTNRPAGEVLTSVVQQTKGALQTAADSRVVQNLKHDTAEVAARVARRLGDIDPMQVAAQAHHHVAGPPPPPPRSTVGRILRFAVAGAATAALAYGLYRQHVPRAVPLDLHGKTVVVTGAGVGIGRAIAVAARARGAHVVLCGRRTLPLEDTARLIGESSATVVGNCDVTKEADVQRLLDAAMATGLPIAMVALNAGRDCCGEFDTSAATLDNQREIFELNYTANVRLAQLFLPALQRARGAFCVISSVAGLVPVVRANAYCPSKHALTAFFDIVRLEQARHGVSVTTVCPSFTVSDIHQPGVMLTTAGAPPPRNQAGWLTSEAVGAEAVTATVQRRPMLVLPRTLYAAYLLRPFAPRLVEWIVARSVYESFGDDGSRTLQELAAAHNPAPQLLELAAAPLLVSAQPSPLAGAASAIVPASAPPVNALPPPGSNASSTHGFDIV
jgi:short-subunit dehydrogenase